MKVGDLVHLSYSPKSYVNMYEDDLGSIENGERFFSDEIGLVLESKGNGKYTYLKVLTPRGAMGWIHNFHLKIIP